MKKSAFLISTLMFVLLTGLLLWPRVTVRAATFTVTTIADSGAGSLRQAILDANANPGLDTITFAIGATGSRQTIAPLTNLPTISDPVVLDGWTQGGGGYAGPPLIELDGSNLTASSNRGFRITAGDSTVRGFVIHSFDDAGSSAIWLHTADGNWIAGNYIGTNADGTATLPNHYGIWINNRGNSQPSHDNVIGTNGDGVDDAFEGNVIAGSIQEDVRVETNGNWIAGNYIGTTADGSAALPGNNTGVRLYADDNVVGTNGDGVSDDLEGNLISGHDYGIGINNSSNHTIAGNIIGLDVTGGVILGNDFNGIDCNASAATSRDILIEGNVISGNGSRGYSTFYNNCRHVTITGNKIGTNISGTVALGNGAEGIIVSAGDWYTITHNIISGNGTNGMAAGITTGDGANRLTITDNIVGSDINGTADLGNTGDGIEIQFSNHYTIRENQIGGNGSEGIMINAGDAILVQENLIGVQADGSSVLDNDDHGVYISGDAHSSTVISNTIAYSGRRGVLVDGSSQTISNTISANAIFANDELGIDLDFDGVTPTDEDDVDTGPNGLQNHPAVLTATNTVEAITIGGVLDSTPETTFTLEFFSNAACDVSGNGEGAVYLGRGIVTTLPGSGAANDTPYTITLPVQVPEGRYLTATATGPEGTSEFSVCYGPTGPVQDTPIDGLVAANDGPQLDSNPAVLTATISSGSNVSYQWDPGDGSGPLPGRVVTHTYAQPGTYTAVVTATNNVGQESATTDVTINRSGAVSGSVWDDWDGDGYLGPGEAGFGGETVRAEQNGRVYTATTGSDGSYALRGLRGGSYTLFAPTISGYKPFGAGVRILSMPSTGAAVGQWLPYRANFTGVRGRAWEDDNFNGRYDGGETLLAGHLVDLTAIGGGTSFVNVPTDGDGLFQIDLSANDGDHHVLSGDTPAFYEAVSRTLNGANQNGYTANLDFRPGAIGGCVGGAGGATVSGLTVALRGGNGQTLATTNTGGDGCYLFGQSDAQDAASVRLTPAGDDLIVGPAVQPAVYLGTPLRVDWDVTEPGSVQIGIAAVDGASVSGGQSTVGGYQIDLETPGGVLTATTGANGVAHFDSVPPGPITATVPLSGDNIGVSPASWRYDLPAGGAILGPGFFLGTHGITAECRTPPVPGQEPNGRFFPCTIELFRPGEDPFFTQSLAEGEQFFYQPATGGSLRLRIIPDDPNALEMLFAFIFTAGESEHYQYPLFLPGQLGPISGEVWTDSNANGTHEPTEGAGIGFAVELLDTSGTVLESTTTDTYGRYQLYPDSFGTFRVRIDTGILVTTARQRTVVREPSDTTSDIVDFGIALPADGLEGRVRFSDLWRSNASGVTVQLRQADNGTLLDTTTTSPTGHFNFDGLLPDDYLLRILPPNGGTAIERLVTAAVNGTPYQEITLPPDGNKPTVFVFADENGNEVADPGEGLPGVSVAFDLGTCGNVIDVNETNSDGFVASELVFPEGGCARITAGLPEGLAPARPDGVVLAPYDGGIVSLRAVAEGTLQLRPFWDRNGNGQRDANEPIRLDDISVSVDGISVVRSQHALYLSGPTGTYDFLVVARINSSAVLLRPNQVTGVISSLTENELPIPLGYENTLTGEVVGPNGGAVSGLTIELRDVDNTLIAATTTGVAPVSQPGGRSYTPPPATTGGPAAAPFTFDNVAPGSYTVRVATPPGNMASSPAAISFDPADSGSVRLRITPIDTISGVVYWDNDYNGRRDGGEPGTDFYDVVLLNDAGLPPQTLTPAGDGTFVFTGLQAGVGYALTVPDLYDAAGGVAGNWLTESPGWFERGALAHAPIGIGNYGDGNPNSLAVGQVYVQNGASRDPSPGATVGYYQLQGSAGFCNAANPSILGQTTTDGDGRYRLPLTYIPGGGVQYCIVVLEVPGLVQNDLTVIADAAVAYTLPGGQTIYDQALNLDMNVKMREVANSSQRTLQQTIADSNVNWLAFRDDNFNGMWNDGEFPLPGVVVAGGAITATSAIDGSGVITLANGEHTLTITPPAGYAPVGPDVRTIWLAGSDVALSPIGFAPDSAVGGILFADKDGDGWLGGTGDEFGLGDATITLDGPVMRTTATAVDGRFSLRDLPDGSYAVSASVPAGYTAAAATLTVSDGFGIVRIPAQSTGHLTGALYDDWDGDGLRLADERLAAGVPLTVTVPGVGSTLPLGGTVLFWDVAPGSYTVQPWWTAAASADVTLGGNNGGGFGLPAVPPGVVRGTLWLDANDDGVRQPWEAPLSGVEVTLDGDTSVVTDGKGHYTFANVATGSHDLTVNLPEGLTTTIPAGVVTDGRGAVVGIPVSSPSSGEDSHFIFLPLATK